MAVGIAGCQTLMFPEGFTFPFGGVERSFVRVYGTGFLSFDAAALSGQGPNARFPTDPSFAAVHMAPFWDGLGWDTSRFPAGNIYWLHREDAAGDSLVIQWRNVGFADEAYRTADLNFEVILWESGDFEYRYGRMDPGPASENWAKGSSAAIGYQLPDQSDADTRHHNNNPSLRGSLVGRSLRFTRTPAVAASGSYLWHPYAAVDTVSVTLTASRGDVADSQTRTIEVKPRPEVVLQEPAPTLVGESFRIGWESQLATGLRIIDQAGNERCRAAGQAEVDEGFCSLSEEEEGLYRYRIVATAASGLQVEQTLEVLVYEDFGALGWILWSGRLRLRVGEDEPLPRLLEHRGVRHELPFFGSMESPRWVSAMGWISFSPTMPSSLGIEPPRTEAARSSDVPPSPILAAFWDLLKCERNQWDCTVHQWEGTIDGEQVLIVQWSNFRRGTSSSFSPGSVTFQAQLYANGEVVVAFEDAYADPGANATAEGHYRGSQAWIGLEARGNTDWVSGNRASSWT